MLKKITLTLVALLAVFLGYVAMQPAHFTIARDISINAPASRIFPYVNNRKLSNSWNPWLLQDKQAKIVLSGPEEGVGSQTSWSEGKMLGTGSATISESVPNEHVVVKLEYQKPFKMSQNATFMLKETGSKTNVTWKVEGENTFLCRLMGMFMNMDKMVSDTFTQGLRDLKSLVEKPA